MDHQRKREHPKAIERKQVKVREKRVNGKRIFFSSNPFHFCPNPGTFLCHLIVSSLSPSLSTFSPFFQLGLAQQDTSIPSLLVVFVLTFPLLPVSSAALRPTKKTNCSTNWQQVFFLLVFFSSNVNNFSYHLNTRIKG